MPIDKPIVSLHVSGLWWLNERVSVLERAPLALYCNVSARPSVEAHSIEWRLNGRLLVDERDETLQLAPHATAANVGIYSCKCANRHGDAISHIKLDLTCN